MIVSYASMVGAGSANPLCRGMPMSIFEVMMVLLGFGTFLIAMLGLIISMINKK